MVRRRAEALGTPRAGPTVISSWEGARPWWALELQPPRRICSNSTLSLEESRLGGERLQPSPATLLRRRATSAGR